MNSKQQFTSLPNTSPAPFAYFWVAMTGAMVGTDYAKWLDVNAIIGAILGGVISLVMIKVIYILYLDPDGHVKATVTKIGALVGALMGGYIAMMNGEPYLTWIIGAIIGGGIGGAMGQMATAAIVLFSFALFFVSQGPVGLAVRTYILNLN